MDSNNQRGGIRRVVVSGLGVVSPIGTTVASFWESALQGRVGTGPLTQIDTSCFRYHNGGEILDFHLDNYVHGVNETELARCTQLAVAVTQQCLEDAQLEKSALDSFRVGVCFGSVMGPRPHCERTLDQLLSKNRNRNPRPAMPAVDPCDISRVPARQFHLEGPNLAIVTTCATGNTAIGCALDLIRSGAANAMVAGGTEQLSLQVFSMFAKMSALSPNVVSPFASTREGLLLSEGAAALFLESYEHALARRARIYCEVLSHGNCTDDYHLTAPDPQGAGASRAMKSALSIGRIEASRVGFINAHGTGTLLNDVAEARALHQVFPKDAASIPVTALKSLLGHTSGAAGAIQAVATVLSISQGIIPPTGNCDEVDAECALNVIRTRPFHSQIDVALSNSFGFGGSNECLAFAAIGG